MHGRNPETWNIKLQIAWQAVSLRHCAIKNYSFLGYETVKSGKWVPRYRRNILPSSSGQQTNVTGSIFTEKYGECMFLLQLVPTTRLQCHKPRDHNMNIHHGEDLIPYTTYYRVFRAQTDWTFILPSKLPAKELRHLPRKIPPSGTTYWEVW
jgi:hypothetical protein